MHIQFVDVSIFTVTLSYLVLQITYLHRVFTHIIILTLSACMEKILKIIKEELLLLVYIQSSLPLIEAPT